MKKKLALLLAAAFSAGTMLTMCVSADFSKSKTYADGMFTDVVPTEWYVSSVKDAYEFGIMQGDSATTFNPGGTLTVAEGVTIAARIYETLNNKPIADAEGEWYAKYVAYAVANGFLKEGAFDNYDREIKRFEIAELLADVCGDLLAINTVESIPDVAPGAPYADKVIKLYKAGILTGNDNYGTFAPSSNLLRSEISAMAVRIADSSKRVQKTFEKLEARVYSDAYYIIEAVMPNGRNGLANGWNYDNRFDLFNTSGSDKTVLYDTADDKFYSLIRDFKPESDGVLRLEIMADISGSDNGPYIAFENADEEKLFQLTPKNGKWAFVGATETATDVAVDAAKSTRYAIVMEIDLDYNTANVIINNIECGSIQIPDGSVERLVLGTNKVGTGSISMIYARLSKNYAVNEHFLVGTSDEFGKAPAAWNVTGDFKLEKINSMRGYDLTSVKADAKAGSVSTATKTFTPVTGKLSFETMILLPEKTDGASVSLLSSGAEAVKFETRDGKIYVGDTMVNDYIPNVWQTLHVEADTAAGSADIYVNGKKKTTVAITAKTFDGINVSFKPTADAVMWFDDVELYNVIERADYPAQPQVAESKDYNIGLNVCWLWRDQQSGEGWDSTSPFPEFDPYLGFYDEGLRETADWELKWMAEHGIDFIHACWYCPDGDIRAPIKEMRHSYAALHDGYMMAKYSDLVDFCIMWENNGQDCTSFEQFRDYIWSYWMEYYFSDPRYARLDNKAVLTIWNRSKFEKAFGGAEGTRKAVEFMNEELKKIGYDGIIILASTQGANNAGTYTDISNLGYDATYGYHWGPNGKSGDYQIDCNQKNVAASAEAGSHHIPTVSVGFNDVGRNETRDPIVTKADHLRVCEDIKTTLATFKTNSWKDNTLFVSTWNEYSEGTYVFPTASNGFDYLENIRLTFTDDKSDHSALDVKPTAAQIERVTHLYPPNHAPIRWFQFEQSDLGKDDGSITGEDLEAFRTYDLTKPEGIAAWKPNHGITGYSDKNGVISGTGAGEDYGIITNELELFNAVDAPILHLRMKNSEKANIEIYYTTSSSPSMDSKKLKTTAITETGKFVDYYINMASTGSWTDQIVSVRIDPQTKAGSFEISLIEFMNYPSVDVSKIPGVKVNGNQLTFTFDPKELADGDYEVVGEARKMGFYSALRVYHEWDRFTGDGVLTLKTRDERTLVFTVGSDKVVIDGKEQPAGFTFKLRDGLPVFHIKKLCDLLGYEYAMEGKTVVIKAASADEYEVIANRKPNEWEFEIPGETEGWKFQNCMASVLDGKLKATPSNTDPAIIQTTVFPANAYNTVTVGIVYNETVGKGSPQLFFTTASSTNYTADKCVDGKYNLEGKKPGDVVEAVFYLGAHNAYSGTITGLRFDPYGGNETFEVDYVRCTKEEVKAEGDKLIEVDDENQWYFDKDGEAEGWRAQNATPAVIAGGALTSTGTNGDPAIQHDVSFDAGEYQVAVVGVRYTKSLDNRTADFFFVTESSPSWSGDKGIKAKYDIPAFTNEGDVVELRFDLTSNKFWTGKVTTIRVDPFSAAEPFAIDYVRLYKREGYEAPEKPVTPEKPAEPAAVTKPVEAVISTAGELPEGVTVYTEPSTKISVVDDPENAGKKVYKAECIKTGEQYTYLNVGMQFKAGATYQVSYKIYPLKDMNGKDFASTIIGGNFRFATTEVPSVKDHTFASEANRSSGQGWISVTAEFTVPENYTPGNNDCFQLWGKPVNETGICYLASDFKIELKK